MIYLIRHTTPAVAKGICYGQTDLDVTESFNEEAEVIRQHLPAGIGPVYSSPLKRCTLLAGKLFPARPLRLMPELMEIHCGQWEMRAWDELPPQEVDPWMADFVRIRIPGGESYQDLHDRVSRCWATITREDTAAHTFAASHATTNATTTPHATVPSPATASSHTTPTPDSPAIAVVAHGGVLRSILSGITGTPLIDSFSTFSLHYGCVVRLFFADGGWKHEIVWNQAPPEKEQHKPKAFYKQ